MMDLREKAEKMSEMLKDENIVVTYRPVIKNNVTLDALGVRTGRSTEAVLYYTTAWEFMDDEAIKSMLLDAINKFQVTESDLDFIKNRDWILDHIYVKLISNVNTEFLSVNHLPLYPVMDMFAIFYVRLPEQMIAKKDGITATMNLTSNVLSMNNITLEEAYKAAVSNLEKELTICNITDEIMKSVPPEFQDSIHMADFFLPIWICSNKINIQGAAVMLCPSFAEAVSEYICGDVYVLPSSIHECLIAPASDMDPEEAVAMVREVNATKIDPENKLTDSVYLLHEGSISKIA